jgi:hypothetical protein
MNIHIFTLKQGDDFDGFKSEGLHEKRVVATWNLRNHISISLKTEESQENRS